MVGLCQVGQLLGTSVLGCMPMVRHGIQMLNPPPAGPMIAADGMHFNRRWVLWPSAAWGQGCQHACTHRGPAHRSHAHAAQQSHTNA